MSGCGGGSAEPIVKGSFLRQGSMLYRVRNPYPSIDGFLICETDQMDADALQSATFTVTGTLNLVTDTYPTVSVAVKDFAIIVKRFLILVRESRCLTQLIHHVLIRC